MKSQKARAVLVGVYGVMVFAGVAGAGMAGGCNQQSLFMDADRSTDSLKYWGNDSARATTESRKRGSDMGVGIPAMGSL